ncbi:alpha/beta hydrolase [Streptomyces sp. NBC_01142]|uniref:alpha/beta hydrolase family protein n=1 Tax=Streptomyces sp. NBC_01142 TaxID=2975865 RepID=UPI002257F779|nr:alpha/beta hydrolase [Streptomyces sp. NBC_01142]MCX4825458.1 alpha/beta hydrolase [Streptomyces sp. NBC_01142]
MTGVRHVTFAAALVLSLAGTGTALAAPQPVSAPVSASALSDVKGVQLQLPRPTGPYAVGRGTLHLVDKTRRDPWVPKAGARELMVSMYFPARSGTGSAAAPYMSTQGARLLLESRELEDVVPAEVLSGTRTHSAVGARPAHGRFPLVVLSPGFGMPRTTISALAEDLTSRGYVVATVDHAYEAVGVAFPGGRTLPCTACDLVGEDGIDTVATGRAKDLSFVLDTLTGHHPAWRYARMIDAKRIGMAGHSIGGASTAATMAVDRRVRAGVNMDGKFAAAPPGAGLGGRPFMMLGTEADNSPGSEGSNWDEAWTRLEGWKGWLTVAGSGHFAFTDLPVLGAQLGLSDPSEPLPGQRAGEITRDYVGAFFDLHLRGIGQPLLDGPSPANPEVTLHHSR